MYAKQGYQGKQFTKPEHLNRLVLQDASGLIQIYEYTPKSIALVCDKETGQAWSANFKSCNASFTKLAALGSSFGWLFWRNNPNVYGVLNQFIQAVNSTPGRSMSLNSNGLLVAVDTNFDLSQHIASINKIPSPHAIAVFPGGVGGTFPQGNVPQQGLVPTIQGLQIAGIPTQPQTQTQGYAQTQNFMQGGFAQPTPTQMWQPQTAHIIKPASPIQLPKERSLIAIITELYDKSQDLTYDERVDQIDINNQTMVLLSGSNENVSKLMGTYTTHALVINIQVGMFMAVVLQPPQ
jgi:hypothetical protein